MRMLRLPAALPASLRSLRSPVPSRASLSLPMAARRWLPWAWRFQASPWLPEPLSSMETAGPPRFLGNPNMNMPWSQTPVGLPRQAPFGVSVLPSAISTASAPTKIFHFEAPYRAYSLAVYASRRGLPRDRARLASGWWPTFAGQDLHLLGFNRKFQRLVTSYPPPPGLPGATRFEI